MEKIILANGFECEIKEGASLSNITVVVEKFDDLEAISEALTTKGNLDVVKFSTNDNISGEYSDMVLVDNVFTSVDTVDGKVEATFGLREKTDIEKRLDVLEANQADFKAEQEIQDEAIVELADIVAGGE